LVGRQQHYSELPSLLKSSVCKLLLPLLSCLPI
jgi:hypothetical protein